MSKPRFLLDCLSDNMMLYTRAMRGGVELKMQDPSAIFVAKCCKRFTQLTHCSVLLSYTFLPKRSGTDMQRSHLDFTASSLELEVIRVG